MAKSAVLALKITGDASGAKRAFADADGASRGFGSKLAGVATAAGGAIAVVGVLGKAAFDSASELQQQAGAVDAVFGKNAAKMHAYAEEAAKTVGLAESQYSGLASVLGAQLSNAGFAGDKLTGTTDGLIKKGADLAAQFGGSTADAVEALSSVLKGETDPIEKYGVSIKQSDINARLAATGQDNLTGAALKSAQAQAALSLVTDQTKTSTGAFARESDTAAGVQQRLGAEFEDLKAKLGEKLLPIFQKVGKFILEKAIPAFEKLWKEHGPAVKAAFQKIGEFIEDKAIPAFKAIWKFVKDNIIPLWKNTLKPAIDGVKSAFKTVSEKIGENKDSFDKLYKKLKPVFEFLRDKVAPFVGTVLKGAFEGFGTVIGAVIDSIAWIIDKGSGVIDWLTGGGGVANGDAKSGAMMGAAAGSVGGRFGSMGGGGFAPAGLSAAAAAPTTTVNITVEGALDPIAVGRQIDQLVRRYAQVSGRAPVAIGWAG